MTTEQTIFRLRPSGYTGDSLKEFRSLLLLGWHAKFITPIETNNQGGVTCDYILEREVKL